MHRRSESVRAAALERRLRCLAVGVAALLGCALAQPAAQVVLGFGGVVVADAWNPVQVVLRNAEPTVLEIFVDQGSLREGEIVSRYRAEVPGGTGLVTFSDDVFVPTWRSLQWRLASDRRLLASGTLGPRDADTRPLHLVVSQRPGAWRGYLPDDARVLDRNGPDLPGRAAAYDGVATILVDGTTAPPRPEAILAAAATGTTVALVGPLPAGYADIELLASSARTSYGNGRIVRADADGLEALLDARSALDADALRAAMADHLELDPPRTMGTGGILAAAAGYILSVLLAVRFGRLPGAAAALALAVVASVAAWSALRPAQTAFRASAALEIGAGGIARRTALTQVLSLPAAEMRLEGQARTLDRRVVASEPSAVTVPLSRWGTAALATPPAVRPQRLVWNGSELENRSDTALTDVYVVGVGRQGTLGPGERRAPVRADDVGASSAYGGLLELLPPGTAVARAGNAVVIALGAGAGS